MFAKFYMSRCSKPKLQWQRNWAQNQDHVVPRFLRSRDDVSPTRAGQGRGPDHEPRPARTAAPTRGRRMMPPVPIAINRTDHRAGPENGPEIGVDRDFVPHALALRHPVGTGLPAAGRRRARRAHGRGDRSGAEEARRTRALAAREPASGSGALRDGRPRRRAEPLEHPSSAPRAPLGECVNLPAPPGRSFGGYFGRGRRRPGDAQIPNPELAN